jgi:hypothetical protein
MENLKRVLAFLVLICFQIAEPAAADWIGDIPYQPMAVANLLLKASDANAPGNRLLFVDGKRSIGVNDDVISSSVLDQVVKSDECVIGRGGPCLVVDHGLVKSLSVRKNGDQLMVYQNSFDQSKINEAEARKLLTAPEIKASYSPLSALANQLAKQGDGKIFSQYKVGQPNASPVNERPISTTNSQVADILSHPESCQRMSFEQLTPPSYFPQKPFEKIQDANYSHNDLGFKLDVGDRHVRVLDHIQYSFNGVSKTMEVHDLTTGEVSHDLVYKENDKYVGVETALKVGALSYPMTCFMAKTSLAKVQSAREAKAVPLRTSLPTQSVFETGSTIHSTPLAAPSSNAIAAQ